jgi:uncharacterized protein
MTALALAFAALIGVLLGLLGGGGSILTVPVFVYLLGFTPKTAIAMSLPVVGATSLVGALGHWRAGNVRLRTALTFGACAMLGSFAGARLARHMTGQAQLVLLAIVMLGSAVTMFRARPADEDELPRAVDALALGGGTLALVLWVGLAVGVLTGLVGVGGGFLIVPALVVLGRIPIKQSVGTSLLVIAMNAASAFAGYLGTVDVEWRFVSLFTGVAMVGILVGTRLVRHVSAAELKRAFAVFLVLMATLIIVQNRAVLLGRDPGVPGALREAPAPRR